MAQSLDADQRALRARLAAHSQHAAGKTNTAPARAKFRAQFLDEVDPDRVLSEDERNRRAEHARKAYYTRLAFASAKARAAKAAGQVAPDGPSEVGSD